MAISKVNLNAIYNKTEDYQPMSSKKNGVIKSHYTDEKTIQKYKQILEEDQIVDIDALRKLAWQGVPMGRM